MLIVFFLCEHQSSVDPLMPFRIWQYVMAIWHDHIKQTGNQRLPLVIPVVFYHGKKIYDGFRDIRELIDAPIDLVEQVLFKPFHLIDTHDISDETLREQCWAGVMTFIMKHIFIRDFAVHIEPLLEMLRTIDQKQGTFDYIVLLLKYLIEAGNVSSTEVFVEKVKEQLSSPIGDKLMSIANQLIEKGMQQGLQQGEFTILSNMIEYKFGTLPSQYRKKIELADANQLLCLGRRLLEAESLQALFEQKEYS